MLTTLRLFEALGNARQLKLGEVEGKKADKLAAEIATICTGDRFAAVRELAADYRAAKDADARQALAGALYEQLGALVAPTADGNATVAPVTAMGA